MWAGCLRRPVVHFGAEPYDMCRGPFKSKWLRAACERHIGDDPEQQRAFEQALADHNAARQTHDLRASAGPSQRELARRTGTTASVICQLEDAGQQGHSLLVLRRIAAALNRRVEIRFVPVNGKQQPA